MVCILEMDEKPKLRDPVLIEGLPGIGFVANITALHLIHELKAKRFAEIHSSSFQDLAVTTANGATLSPLNELYYYKGREGERDMIIWYGNTQALTTLGQYELCGRVLDVAKELGCKYIITLGGFRQEEIRTTPQIYCAASDSETLQEALGLGTKIMVGQVFGIAGIMVGLAGLRGLKSFSLLVDTLGTHPDANATRVALEALNKFLKMNVDISKVDAAAEETEKILESFGLIRNVGEEKKREEQQFRWFI
ncbi:MAG TPA: PAC2 family protein [Patescibacteria group bacterium]|nr:PAC2 family protein [Patescibacteria group bacterium]